MYHKKYLPMRDTLPSSDEHHPDTSGSLPLFPNTLDISSENPHMLSFSAHKTRSAIHDIYGTELYLQLTPEYHEAVVKRTESYVGNIFPEVQE